MLPTRGTSVPTTSEELCALPGRGKCQPYFVYFFTIFSTNWWMSFQELPMLSDLKTKKTWLRGMRHLLLVGSFSAFPVSSSLFSNSFPPRVAEGCHPAFATSLGHPGGDFHQCQWWGRWPTWFMCLGIRGSVWLIYWRSKGGYSGWRSPSNSNTFAVLVPQFWPNNKSPGLRQEKDVLLKPFCFTTFLLACRAEPFWTPKVFSGNTHGEELN